MWSALRPALRPISTMSASITSSPFTKAVVQTMRKIYPESLAESSWDNTGLLLEAPYNPHGSRTLQKNSVLLTVDLTKAVADEAIQRRDSVIIAYHPIIFRGLKSISLNDTQQQSLLRLAQEGISVYSPHTAVDAVPDGMADWLCDIVTGAIEGPSSPGHKSGSQSQPHPSIVYPVLGKNHRVESSSSSIPRHTKETIHLSPSPVPEGFETAGAGRLVAFSERQSLLPLLHRIKRATGNPASLSVAIPQSRTLESITISTVGVCPGSGAGVLMKAGPLGPPDLLLTGELSHHDALAAIERGSVVVTLFHSNAERGYLHDVMQQKLTQGLRQLWETTTEEAKDGKTHEQWGDFSVDVSQSDRDPYGILIL